MSDFKSRLPRDLYTASQVRDLDRIAIEQMPIPGIELMQRAAGATLALLLDQFPQVKQVIMLSGTGNNGGDGYMMAVLAKQQGIKVDVIQVGDHTQLQGDALLAARLAQKAGLPINAFDPQLHQAATLATILVTTSTVIVDALLGTGLDRDVSPEFARAIEFINSTGLPIVAVDVPSGICSDTGRVRGTAVKAQHTVTFIGLKRGMLTGAAVDYCGIIHFTALDLPEKLYSSTASPRPDCQRIDMQLMSRKLLPRSPSSHKGDFGHTVVIGGDYGFGGAVSMAGEAALRGG
ncbi:MAG: NAD(P)H-hydrate epimerase, partial [Pseudohongiellaceae bacterium]